MKPEEIQDLLNELKFNFERRGETCRSPLETLRAGSAHCFEGALLASALLWAQGEQPLLLDLRAAKSDLDHVVALFKRRGYWGAISKTNHAVLRYREPIYKTPRELALSYFHEYFLPDGTKTLKSFSEPFDLRKFGREWIASPKNLFYLAHALDKSKHHPILPKGAKLRKADSIEVAAGKITEY